MSELHSNQVHKGQNYPSQYTGQNIYYQNQNSENSTQDCYFFRSKEPHSETTNTSIEKVTDVKKILVLIKSQKLIF